MGYEILEHTADVKFRATGDSLEEAFEDVVRAFSELSSEGTKGNTRHKIEVKSENSEALLFDFLDELIFLQETEGIAIGEPKELSIEDNKGEYSLEATVYADAIDPGATIMDIKAPTYNEMKVDYVQGEGWIVEAVLDI